MRNIRLTLAYDGTRYVGWQVQPNGPSVQAAVERAIHKLTGEEANVLAAGRTDSGVHALGQVASFNTAGSLACKKIRTGLQHFLPGDIVVRDVCEVPPEFHATYSATAKRYRYVVLNSPRADPFVRDLAWHYRGSLDVEAMHTAAQHFVGTHDFRCFETQFPNKATSVRTVRETTMGRLAGWSLWRADRSPFEAEPAAGGPESASREFICFEIVADGFLYNMVRAMMGTLQQVGRGARPAGDIPRIIASGDRAQAGETAPACGLYLVEVEYDSPT